MTQTDDDTAMAARQIVSTLVPREIMKPLMMKSNGPAAVHLLAHLLLIGGLAYLVGSAQGHWLVWPAMFVLGVVLTHLFAPQQKMHSSRQNFQTLKRPDLKLLGCAMQVRQSM